jgi:hypothetical protein
MPPSTLRLHWQRLWAVKWAEHLLRLITGHISKLSTARDLNDTKESETIFKEMIAEKKAQLIVCALRRNALSALFKTS